MMLAELIAAEPQALATGDTHRDVTGLAYDSRRVENGNVFFAWKGEVSDGHRFIPAAREKGAGAVVLEDAAFVGSDSTTYVTVPNARQALARMAATYYGRPDRSMTLVGVTGTNGKTTTCFVIKHLLAASPSQVGLLGTVRYEIGERIVPAKRTTPEGLDLHRMLNEMQQADCRYAVMEVSSHALEQGRVLPLEFNVGVFTNLSQDHMDYHGSMDRYFEAKRLLFNNLDRDMHCGMAVLNADDPHSERLDAGLDERVKRITYSACGRPATISVRELEFSVNATKGRISFYGEDYAFAMPLVGPFNVANALAAAGAALACGVEPRDIVERLHTTPSVPGRLELFVSDDGVTVIVDYAHTDDAVRKALEALRPLTPGRLIAVVGCGGDRDAAKRPLMAKAAAEAADQAIFTSDNPRGEDPEQILDHMIAGVANAENISRITDRREAIAEAVASAAPGDVVCIAGKGHETTQEIKGTKLPFDDRLVVQDFITRRQPS